MRFASALGCLLVVCCLSANAATIREMGDSPARGGALIVENLRERLDQSTNPTERAVLAERLRFSEARVANDASAMRSAINGLQAIADENAGDAFGAEALVRAAEYSAEIGEYTVARAFWDEASSRYQSHKEWRDWENRAVSCAIQSGDMLCREGETSKAIETWKDAFRRFKQVPMAAQIPEKVRLTQKACMGPEEAWQSGVEFFDEAIELCGQAKWIDRFDLERFYARTEGLSLVVDGKLVSLVSREELLKELDGLLEKYPTGKSRLFDDQRAALLSMRENYLPASQRANPPDPRINMNMYLPDLELDALADLPNEQNPSTTPEISTTSPLTENTAPSVPGENVTRNGWKNHLMAYSLGLLLMAALAVWLIALRKKR